MICNLKWHSWEYSDDCPLKPSVRVCRVCGRKEEYCKENYKFSKVVDDTKKSLVKIFLGRHHVRANFYHLISILFVVSMVLWMMGFISDKASTIISFTLFIVDYLAEMYDPHPDNPGSWFKAHFHRFFDNEE